mmetsp:Transcript_11877/g.43448  ORF Transcript_11877/g.43448 Transcript_11877/m.43448 type:complete len:233 (+) Transcript_11877:75-773(+)
MASSGNSRASTGAGTRLPVGALLLVLVVACFQVVGKVGDALVPRLVVTSPELLLALNSNDLHLILVATSLSGSAYYTIGTVRRCSEDFLFFFIGFNYSKAARGWIKQYSSWTSTIVDKGLTSWTTALFGVLMLLFPNAALHLLAGTSRMKPVVFISLSILATLARLFMVRGAGAALSAQVAWVQNKMAEFQTPALLLSAGLAVVGTVTLVRQHRAHMSSPSGDETADDIRTK